MDIKKRALRRSHKQKIKSTLKWEVEVYNKETRRWFTSKHQFTYLKNEGKDRSYSCSCSWCLSNKTINRLRSNERMTEEYKEYLKDRYYED